AVTWCAMKYLTDAAQPFKDSLTTVLFVIGQILLTMAVWQQWIFWIAGNIVNIVLWSMVMASGDMVGGLMVIKYSMYMINCINGIVIWRRTAKAAK
ncbi:MAG: nicotinamide riboside transporter PnuC, partial [Alistipes sp.]|nr:nicotinamide riboside transporter PnuC [Alistipes sp.]